MIDYKIVNKILIQKINDNKIMMEIINQNLTIPIILIIDMEMKMNYNQIIYKTQIQFQIHNNHQL